MPTAGRLVAAVLYAALGWYVSGLMVPLFPEGTDLGYLAEINAGIGVICGWKVAGPRAGTGYASAFSYGLTTLVAMLVIGLFTHSFIEMIKNSLRKFYKGPMDALVDVFSMAIENAQLIATAEIAGTLLAGSVVAALITEFVGRRAS